MTVNDWYFIVSKRPDIDDDGVAHITTFSKENGSLDKRIPESYKEAMEDFYHREEHLPVPNPDLRARVRVMPNLTDYASLTGQEKVVNNMLYGTTPMNYCESTGEKPCRD